MFSILLASIFMLAMAADDSIQPNQLESILRKSKYNYSSKEFTENDARVPERFNDDGKYMNNPYFKRRYIAAQQSRSPFLIQYKNSISRNPFRRRSVPKEAFEANNFWQSSLTIWQTIARHFTQPSPFIPSKVHFED